MNIRDAARTDAEWILHHRLGLFRDSGASEEVIDETDALTKRYLTMNWTDDFRYFLAERDGDVIGGCGLSVFRIPPLTRQRTGLMAYIFNMYVEPKDRRNGVGRELLNHVVGVCMSERVGVAILHASEVSRRLYTSCGFTTSESLMHLPIRNGGRTTIASGGSIEQM
ncbi:MAG: GNAT family N-acetyltransferase [Candidatus Thorarchaeota archaeon]|nr:MAG: GNAT family N-acetyltransferase [Candidatus Thorarchaeota archaeon]